MTRRFGFSFLSRREKSSQAAQLPDADLIAASGLFDASFYLIEGPDVEAAGLDPIAHFNDYGWQEGRRPNLYFDPLWYRDRHLKGADATNPLAHYIAKGEADGARPICFFDPTWYRRAYRLSPHQSPLRHYLAYRRSARFAPNGHFDLAFYLARYGEEIGPNRDPFAHLLRHGVDRDLDPSPHFDSAAYRRLSMTAERVAAKGMAARERAIPFIHALDALHPMIGGASKRSQPIA